MFKSTIISEINIDQMIEIAAFGKQNIFSNNDKILNHEVLDFVI